MRKEGRGFEPRRSGRRPTALAYSKTCTASGVSEYSYINGAKGKNISVDECSTEMLLWYFPEH